MSNNFVTIDPQKPNEPLIEVGSQGVYVTVYGLDADTCIRFKRVIVEYDDKSIRREGCCIWLPKGSPAEIVDATDYKIGVVAPTISAKRPTILLNQSGIYLPVVESSSPTKYKAELRKARCAQFATQELGIDPPNCGPSAYEDDGLRRCTFPNGMDADTYHHEKHEKNDWGQSRWSLDQEMKWQPSGTYICEQHRLKEQQTTICGHVRWKDVGGKCGYKPSVTAYYSECGGITGILHAFGEHDDRDPDATVKVDACDGTTLFYLYPEPDPEMNATLRLERCDGTLIGYAINRSEFAQQITCC